MREVYSKGFAAKVFWTSPQEKLWFPRADLVRDQYEVYQTLYLELFYQQKVLHLLYPDNFIDVIGARKSPIAEGEGIIHSLYSKEANICQDHATFAAHLQWNQGGIFGKGKVSSCSCSLCSRHRENHEINSTEIKAHTLATQLYDRGILLDYSNPDLVQLFTLR